MMFEAFFIISTNSFVPGLRLIHSFKYTTNRYETKKNNNRHYSEPYHIPNKLFNKEEEFDRSIYSKLSECDTLLPYEITSEYTSKSAMIGKQSVQYSCDAFTGTNVFQYLRVVKLVGGNYTILNIMGLPKYDKKSPILGIDIVSLPGMMIIIIAV